MSKKLYTVSNDDTRVLFECPGCGCCHQVYVNHRRPGVPVWTWNGSMDKPTFSPSLLIDSERYDPPVTPENHEQWKREPWPQKKVRFVCHSFVRDGMIQFLTDCTHKLAGQTVELPDVE